MSYPTGIVVWPRAAKKLDRPIGRLRAMIVDAAEFSMLIRACVLLEKFR